VRQPGTGDDLSGHLHRKFIGASGLLLPIVLVLGAWLRPTTGLPHDDLLDSVSAYYYTGAVAAFVGTLSALSVFMFTYQGYDNRYRALDRWTALIAGVCAALVAFFPTDAPYGIPRLPWWTPAVGTIHFTSAAILFSCFAFYCLVLFRKTYPGRELARLEPDKKRRNTLYAVCGWGILACLAWAAVAKTNDQPIFWPETIALELFAMSWLVKGRADRVVRHPVESVKGVWRAVRELGSHR
jgi:hypothetical protein